ncbi:hypothetical protein F3Y22_tig00116951pilonHSYRG00102 [Hibiscus syriacus]|uniref:ADF-H domain-containing protein n=1 Tax=Hibiscus syriacus TaxID=106335 RepID=A0A6A2WZ48_HIBSY|nr:hypothetical protein F3Y22_tig00116951pilonHSYRG00102 [Hibiscus syriacus]
MWFRGFSRPNATDHTKDTFLELGRKKVHRYVIFRIDEKKGRLWLTKLVPLLRPKMTSLHLCPKPTADTLSMTSILLHLRIVRRARFFSLHDAYATSKGRLRRELAGIHYEIQATDPTEMDLEVLRDRAY